MGLIKTVNLQLPVKGTLGIWELTESCNTLMALVDCPEYEKRELDKITSEKRKCEFLAVRALLQELLQKKIHLYYDAAGKPFLKDDLSVSIAHSSDLAVVLVSERQAGVDVENLRRNTEKVAPRFLSDKERHQTSSTSDPGFSRLIYWCAKEALFKCTPLSGIDFKNHIEIKPFPLRPDSGIFFGRLHKNNQLTDYEFHYFVINDNVIVYCGEMD